MKLSYFNYNDGLKNRNTIVITHESLLSCRILTVRLKLHCIENYYKTVLASWLWLQHKLLCTCPICELVSVTIETAKGSVSLSTA